MEFTEFFEKSEENLKASQICFENGLYNASANRAYYAIFQAAVVALAERGLKSEQEFIGHDWVQSTFIRELIHRRKVYANKFKSYLIDTQNVRNRADYKREHISQKIASRQLAKAKEFVEAIKRELNK
jgi:uncharacterized protein (UPF0332 family)